MFPLREATTPSHGRHICGNNKYFTKELSKESAPGPQAMIGRNRDIARNEFQPMLAAHLFVSVTGSQDLRNLVSRGTSMVQRDRVALGSSHPDEPSHATGKS